MCRGRFWLDLLAWVPFDLITTLLICPCRDVHTVQYISLARLAHLVPPLCYPAGTACNSSIHGIPS